MGQGKDAAGKSHTQSNQPDRSTQPAIDWSHRISTSRVRSSSHRGHVLAARPRAPLARNHDTRRLPRSLARRQDRRRRVLRPVQAQDEIDRVVGRGQPVGFLRFAGRVLLDVEGERPVRVLLHTYQGNIGECRVQPRRYDKDSRRERISTTRSRIVPHAPPARERAVGRIV